jgi:hypothetical protein
MLRVLLIASVALLIWVAPASAERMPAPPSLTVHHSQNPACMDRGVPVPCADPDTAEIWVPRGADRYAVKHETGHVWWASVATDEQRAWFIRKVGLKTTVEGGRLVDGGWYRGTGLYGNDSPDELAAEAYATCDLGFKPGYRRGKDGALREHWPVAYDYHPHVHEQRRICNAISLIGWLATR